MKLIDELRFKWRTSRLRASYYSTKWHIGTWVRNRTLVRWKAKHPELFVRLYDTVRNQLCERFGHRWSRLEEIKYGNFGHERHCKLCAMKQIHRPNGEVSNYKPYVAPSALDGKPQLTLY